RDLTAEFEAVCVVDFGDFVGKVVGPLVEDAGAGSPEGLNQVAAVGAGLVERGEIGGRQTPRLLRVRCDLVPAPTRCVKASFIDHGGGEGVIPKRGKRVVGLSVIPQVRGANRTVVERAT